MNSEVQRTVRCKALFVIRMRPANCALDFIIHNFYGLCSSSLTVSTMPTMAVSTGVSLHPLAMRAELP